MTPDLRVYAIVDPERDNGRKLADLAALVAQGGGTLVQLRDKHGDTRRLVDEARAIRAALAPFKVPLLINDRVDVALAAGADGVHVGQDDMDAADVRRLLGKDAIVGLSLKSIAHAQAAPIEHLDYVAIGGVFVTTSKDNPDPPVGLDGLGRIAAAVRARAPRMPIVAIAGIDHGNAASVIAAGADGVSVISALSMARDPLAATRDLRGIVERALADRGKR